MEGALPSAVEKAIVDAVGSQNTEQIAHVAGMIAPFVPGVSAIKDVYDAATGYDAIDGHQLSTTERLVAVVGVLSLGEGSALIRGAESLSKMAHEAEGATAWSRAVARAEEGLTKIAPAKRATGVTVLGHNPSYVELGEKLNARYFEVPTRIWDRMSDAERWTANQKFLERTIQRGDQIVLSVRPDMVRPNSYLEKELAYLRERFGYVPSADGTRLVRP
jgi:hypothetical protein